MSHKIAEIKLGQVCFVPTIQEVDDQGNKVGVSRTVLGQLWIEGEELPPETRQTLRQIIQATYEEWLNERYKATNGTPG